MDVVKFPSSRETRAAIANKHNRVSRGRVTRDTKISLDIVLSRIARQNQDEIFN